MTSELIYQARATFKDGAKAIITIAAASKDDAKFEFHHCNLALHRDIEKTVAAVDLRTVKVWEGDDRA